MKVATPPPFDFFGLVQPGLPAFQPNFNINVEQVNLNNQHHQQHIGEVQMAEIDLNLDHDLVPFIGSQIPVNADGNDDKFDILPNLNESLTLKQLAWKYQ
jgi:hypothetical protein